MPSGFLSWGHISPSLFCPCFAPVLPCFACFALLCLLCPALPALPCFACFAPPRYVAPLEDLPNVVTPLRQFNLWVLDQGTVHSGVFPSAPVSSAFSAAFGLLLVLPERRRIGWVGFWFAVTVSVATVYGRYHYAADAAAGLVTTLLALAGIAALKNIDYKPQE